MFDEFGFLHYIKVLAFSREYNSDEFCPIVFSVKSLIFILAGYWFFPGQRKKPVFPKWDFPRQHFLEWMTAGLIIFILVIIGLGALFAPIHTADVLNYHLPRVAHWLQNHTVSHYPSGIEIQNRYPPGAEYQVLHLFALAGRDTLVNFAAWSMLVLSCVSAASFSESLGARPFVQSLSALFVATMPVAIVQASSVKNDLHVAAWTLALGALMMVYVKRRPSWLIFSGIVLTACLGYFTKSSTMLFMLPLIFWFGVRYVIKHRLRRVVISIVFALMLFVIITGGFLMRNFRTYDVLQDVKGSSRLLNEQITLSGTISNFLRNTSFHLQYPWDEFRYRTELFFKKVHIKLGLDFNDPLYTSEGTYKILRLNTYEVFTVNVLHAHLILIAFLMMIILLILGKSDSLFWVPVIASLLGLVIFSALVKWQIFGARYILAVFFLMAPVAADLVGRIPFRWLQGLFSLFLVLCSLPWLLSKASRPLIPLAHFSDEPSILVKSQFRHSFSTPALDFLSTRIENTGCQEVGVYGGGGMPEYHIWRALNAPRDDLTIRWLVAGTPSEVYVDPEFDPCYVVCHFCPADLEQIRDLVPVFRDPSFTIFGSAP